MKVTKGATIRIWCEGSKTLMEIKNPNRDDPFEFLESLTILSDTKNGMTVNLTIQVV